MNAILAILERDLRGAFRGPVGYVVLAAWLALHGLIFTQLVEDFSQRSLQALTDGTVEASLTLTERVIPSLVLSDAFVLLLLLPALAMRSFSEEWRSGRGQLLLSYPLRDGELVLGKWLAAMVQLALMLLLALPHLYLVARYGPLEWPVVFSAWWGLLLQGGTILAISIWLSALTRNQVVAFAGSLAVLLVLSLMGYWSPRVGPPWNELLRQLSLNSQLAQFSVGLLRGSAILYYVGITALSLYAATGAVQARRRGGVQ